MTTKHFDAILAKNDIARELRNGQAIGELGMVGVDTGRILLNLRLIEAYIGESNQPSIASIMTCDKYDL